MDPDEAGLAGAVGVAPAVGGVLVVVDDPEPPEPESPEPVDEDDDVAESEPAELPSPDFPRESVR